MEQDSRILRNAGIKENDNEPENLDEGIGSKMMGLVGLQARPVGTMPRVPGSVSSGRDMDPFWARFSTLLQAVMTSAMKYEDERTQQSYDELMQNYNEIYRLAAPDKITDHGRKLLSLLGASKHAYINKQSGLKEINDIADSLGSPDIQSKLFIGEDEPLPPQVAMGEDKPEPVVGPQGPVQGQEEAPAQQKKRVLPKRPAKRVNDDNIAGMYKELDKQIAQNANDSMKKHS